MNNVNSYGEFQIIIDDKVKGDNKLRLEFSDISITFDLQLEWIDSILRNNSLEKDEIKNSDIKTSIHFKNCKFKKLDCSNISEENHLEINIAGGSIDELRAINSVFIDKFYINKQYGENNKVIEIRKLIISDCIFNENFKLHNSKVNIFSIEDTDFEKHADFFKSSFQMGSLSENIDERISENDIGFKAINFRGLALFGDMRFGKKLIFKYVTFESYSHFRKSKLEKGLDLDYSNIQNEMNFFDVQGLATKTAKENTTQETYRIIKHNFEKIGNKIEANKYLALELEQKKITLETKKPREWLDYLVFKAHWISSEFGTNWLKPMLFIFLTSLMTVGFIHFSLLIDLACSPMSFKLNYISKAINEFFQYMYILNGNNMFAENSKTLLFNKALLGYFYYQFLVSIRKNTK